MSEKVEHTRLDYRTMAESDRIGPWAIHHAPAGKIIATTEKREDAERIVLACNSYPALLAERDRLREALKPFAEEIAGRDDALNRLGFKDDERYTTNAIKSELTWGDFRRARAAIKDTNQ